MKTSRNYTMLLLSICVGLVTLPCWAQGVIFYNVRSDAVYTLQPNDPKPTELVKGFLGRPSPDGRLLAVWQPEQVFDILDIKTGRTIRQIPLKVPLHIDFAWSPNGRWIAYAGNVGGRPIGLEFAEIFLISVQQGTTRQLTFHQGRKRRLVWAPDSRSIFYGEIGAARSKYWEVNINGNAKPKEHNLFHEGAAFLGTPGAFFSFSPSGEEIAYGSAEGDGGVYVANADGTNRRKLTPPGSFRTYQVAWSPDGHQLAFLAFHPATSILYTISLRTQEIQRLVDVSGAAYGLAWTPHSTLGVEPTRKLTTSWGRMKH